MTRAKSSKKRSQRKQSELRDRLRFQDGELRQFMNLLAEWKLDGIAKFIDVAAGFRKNRMPAPIFQSSASSTTGTVRVLGELHEFLKKRRWQPPGLTRAYSVSEFFSVVQTARRLLMVASRLAKGIEQRVLAEQARRILAELHEHQTFSAFDKWVGTSIRCILIEHGRMADELYYLTRSRTKTLSGAITDVVELQAVRPDRVNLSIEGQRRDVLRCGQTSLGCGLDTSPGVDWVTWDTEQLGLPGGSTTVLPVYVQSHLFERLYGREGRLFSMGSHEGLLHDSVYRSLKVPVLHPSPNQPGTYLAEYRFGHLKLGYLVCQVLPDAVVARTFLFLTMDGTPEGQRLYRRTGLRRSDKEYLGLDNLAVLCGTDLATDPDIKSLLAECGLGDIHEYLESTQPLESGYAAACRRYLEL